MCNRNCTLNGRKKAAINPPPNHCAKTEIMNTIEEYEISFEDYVDNVAASILTDEQYHEFQGLFINDRIRYLAGKGRNLIPLARFNGIAV